jgi:integrase
VSSNPQAKGGARDQPTTEHLAESIPVAAEWLFPSSKKAKDGDTIALEKPFGRAAIAAGLDSKQVVRHTLRYTAVSHLVQSGVDLPTVKRIRGHKTLQWSNATRTRTENTSKLP